MKNNSDHVHPGFLFVVLALLSLLCLLACIVEYIKVVWYWGDIFCGELYLVVMFVLITLYFFYHLFRATGRGDQDEN